MSFVYCDILALCCNLYYIIASSWINFWPKWTIQTIGTINLRIQLLPLLFLSRRTIEDKYSGKKMLLSDQELDIIQKIQQREFPEASADAYPV